MDSMKKELVVHELGEIFSGSGVVVVLNGDEVDHICRRSPMGRVKWSGRRKRLPSNRAIEGRSARLAIAVNGGNHEMVSQMKKAQLSLVEGGSKSGKAPDGSATKSMHLALDMPSYVRLMKLQEALHATSKSEVVRRALFAYEIFEPEGVATEEGVKPDRAQSQATELEVKRFFVDISSEMKAQLDDEKANHGRTYKVTISRALCVLEQLVRERAKLVAKLKKGENYVGMDSNVVGSRIPAAILASV